MFENKQKVVKSSLKYEFRNVHCGLDNKTLKLVKILIFKVSEILVKRSGLTKNY